MPLKVPHGTPLDNSLFACYEQFMARRAAAKKVVEPEPAKLVCYELVNPSDAYTFQAPTLLIAACATVLIGRGKYAAHPEDGKGEKNEEVPMFFFGGVEEWFKEKGVESLGDYINAHREEVATCLDTFLIGDMKERKAFDRLIGCISNPEEKEKARLAFHDEKRSSMNNIGEYAWKLAKELRASAAKGKSDAKG